MRISFDPAKFEYLYLVLEEFLAPHGVSGPDIRSKLLLDMIDRADSGGCEYSTALIEIVDQKVQREGVTDGE